MNVNWSSDGIVAICWYHMNTFDTQFKMYAQNQQKYHAHVAALAKWNKKIANKITKTKTFAAMTNETSECDNISISVRI